MGKKHKKEIKKRKHRSRSRSTDKETDKEKRKHHKRHHKIKKKCKKETTVSISSQSDDDVVYVPPPAPKISKDESPPPAPKITPPPPKISSPKSPPPPPPISSSSDNSLSIEQTNALRAKLGLKPLALPKAEATPSSQTDGNGPKEGTVITSGTEEFVHKPAENLGDKKETEKLRERLAERKAKREIEKKLAAVPTLGHASDDDEPAAAWVKKNKKITEERFKAEQKAKELDEMDEVFGIGDLVEDEIKREKSIAYSSANLKGLKVEHDLDGFSEGKSVILTLKDKEVLDEREDALINVNMVDDEKFKKNVANKKLKPFQYNGIDSEEMDFEESKNVLSKYDEEIDGVKKTSFKIGEEDIASRKEAIKQRLQQKTKKTLESLELPEPKIASEYYTPSEMIKIKKPKKKKKIRSKVLKADDLLEANGTEGTFNHLGRRHPMESSVKAEVKQESRENEDNSVPMDIDEDDALIPSIDENVKIEIEDDSELQLALKKARRLKQMPPEKMQSRLPKVEEVLQQIKVEPTENIDASGSAIVLNSTAEFCRTLGDIPTYGLAGNRDEDPSILIDFETERDKIKKMDEEEDDRGGWNDVAMDEKVVEIRQAEAPILDAEPDLGSGVSGALRMAMSKGYLEKEATSRPSASRFAHLAAQNYSIDDKAHAVEDEKLGRRERYLGPTSDFKEKDGYKPNIKLEYIDDDGHILSAKEAFRYLSHKFHGKGPGKNKVEKRMKKNEQEGLMKQMSSTDTPLGTLQMLQQKQKETQSAFVVLSGSKQTTMPPSISKTKMMK